MIVQNVDKLMPAGGVDQRFREGRPVVPDEQRPGVHEPEIHEIGMGKGMQRRHDQAVMRIRGAIGDTVDLPSPRAIKYLIGPDTGR